MPDRAPANPAVDFIDAIDAINEARDLLNLLGMAHDKSNTEADAVSAGVIVALRALNRAAGILDRTRSGLPDRCGAADRRSSEAVTP